MKQKLTTVDNVEGNEIKNIYAHLSSLRELEYIISSDQNEIYDIYYRDLEKTNEAYQNWWSKISKKYNLPVFEKRNWEYDFRTNTIYIL